MISESPRPVLESIIVTGILCLIIGFIILVAVPNYVKEPNTSPMNACINNLRQIEAAKNEWALENGKTNGEIVVRVSDITPYIQLDAKGNLPKCPSGGTYTIGKLKGSPHLFTGY